MMIGSFNLGDAKCCNAATEVVLHLASSERVLRSVTVPTVVPAEQADEVQLIC